MSNNDDDSLPKSVSNDELLDQINRHDPWDVEFKRRFRALVAERDAAIARAEKAEAEKQEARAEALREAAEAVSAAEFYCSPPYDDIGTLSLQIEHSEDAILALIPETDKGDE